ncbi:MAG: AmpG family muropeptide MFS transporter [Rickettsia sp.]|nr:AmpG family muropeptide MFS transporter [Rickettsia sp.]
MKIFIMFGYGLINGTSLMLSGGTLNFWLVNVGVNLNMISLFSFTFIPYSINFIWSYIFDIKYVPYLNKIFANYLSWLIVISVFLFFLLIFISFLNPLFNIYFFAFVTFIICIFSASQDSIIGALRYQISVSDGAALSGTYVTGYRLGMLIANFGAIFLSSFMNWSNVYRIFAFFLLILASTFIYLSHQYLRLEKLKSNKMNIILSKKSLFVKILDILPTKNPKIIFFIIFVICFYRLGNEFLSVVINYFFYQHIGYSKLEIASIGKFCGVLGSILGSISATYIMRKITILNSLFFFGLLNGFSQICLILHELIGKNLEIYFFTTLIQSFSSGMSMSSYIAFITSLCKGEYKAFQYSVFSAFMGFSRAIIPVCSGFLVTLFSWKIFFIVISFVTISIAIFIRYFIPLIQDIIE